MITQYTTKGRQTGIEFVFKYDLQDNLLEFHITGKPLTDEQKFWLFVSYRFPCDEDKLVVAVDDEYWLYGEDREQMKITLLYS